MYEPIPPLQAREINDILTRLDTDWDQRLSKRELRGGLVSMLCELSEKDYDLLWSYFDPRGTRVASIATIVAKLAPQGSAAAGGKSKAASRGSGAVTARSTLADPGQTLASTQWSGVRTLDNIGENLVARTPKLLKHKYPLSWKRDIADPPRRVRPQAPQQSPAIPSRPVTGASTP